MVRLAVSDSPPLTNSGNNSSVTQSPNSNVSGNVNSSYVVHQTDTIVAPSTSSPVQMQQQSSPAQQIAPQPLSIPPHHMPPPFHQSTPNGGHMHDNGHHHNGGTLYLGAYANEFYPGAEAPHGTAYFIPELCPAHTQLCTAVHPEYGKKKNQLFYLMLLCGLRMISLLVLFYGDSYVHRLLFMATKCEIEEKWR